MSKKKKPNSKRHQGRATPPKQVLLDDRIVYCGHCTWWGSIGKASTIKDSRLPGCPFCGSVLFEVENEETWWKQVDKFAKENDMPWYKNVVEWMRGKCFKTFSDAYKEWQLENEMFLDANPGAGQLRIQPTDGAVESGVRQSPHAGT